MRHNRIGRGVVSRVVCLTLGKSGGNGVAEGVGTGSENQLAFVGVLLELAIEPVGDPFGPQVVNISGLRRIMISPRHPRIHLSHILRQLELPLSRLVSSPVILHIT